MSKRQLYIVAAVGLAVMLGAGGFLVADFFGGDEPVEVSLADTAPASEAPATDDGSSFDGEWVVDNEAGEFDYDQEVFTSSYAGYRVDEQLDPIGANTAVGRTRDVTGSMTIAGNQITAAGFTVNMQSFQSDDSRRENTLRERGLQTDTHPTSVFRLTQPVTIDQPPAVGDTVTAQAVGDLTLHGVTRQVTVPLEARWDGSEVVVVSSFDVALADYGIERPTIGFVLSIAETGTVELQLRMRRAA